MAHFTKRISYILLSFVALCSCGDSSKPGQQDAVQASTDSILTAFHSTIWPGDTLALGDVYTDTVRFVEFNDGGDNWLFVVEKNQDTLGLIVDAENVEFFREEELEIQWKMDSIRYAGDPEFLNFTEFIVAARRLKPFQMKEHKTDFLWREMQYLDDLGDEYNVIALDETYIQQISEPEKAALAYATFGIGNECVWDGRANDNRSNLKCKIPWALGLGYQCSQAQISLLKFWFRNDPDILEELEACPTTPDGATVQDTFDDIDISVEGNTITVFFRASGMNMREGQSWKWTEKLIFEFQVDELKLVSRDKSALERETFEVRAN